MKIRLQLMVFFSIIIVTSVGTSAYFAILYTESGIIESEFNKMFAHNAEVMGEIETLHERASEDLVFALQNPKFVEYFELPETKAGNVYDDTGTLQFTANQREIKQDLEQWIYHFQNKFDVDETCIIDASGQEHARLVLTKIEKDENLSPDEAVTPFFEPSFKKPKNEVHVQYPYVSPDTEKWVFAYASPIELNSGQKPAIYHFEMPMTVFENLLDADNGRMFVLDPNGYVVADSQTHVSSSVTSIVPEKQFLHIQHVFGDESSKILDNMKSDDVGSGKYFVNGEEHFYVYEKLSTFDWILVHDKPTSLVLVGHESLSNLTLTILLIALSSSILGLFGTFVISSRISKPISRLAEEICLENPERLGTISAPNHEIGQISNAVNALLKKISKYQEEITLQNRELEIQKQQLERLAKVGELASRLTHNLRTPLTVIKSYVDLLKSTSKDTLDTAALTKLDRIQSASENLEKQIEEVLTYVKNKPLEVKRVKFNDLLHDTFQNIEIPEKIKITSTGNSDYVECDSDKLQIVLMNIITNAIDALKKEGKIEIKHILSNDESVIQISDNGPGIPAEHLPRIFDSLFTTKSSGTGLGLPYCKSVVEQHGGTISASTNPTTFTITIPRKIMTKKS